MAQRDEVEEWKIAPEVTDEVSFDAQLALEQLAEQFEVQLRRYGQRASIAGVLKAAQAEHQERLFRILLELEIEHRRRDGESLDETKYLAEFPQYESIIRQALNAADAGDAPTIGNRTGMREGPGSVVGSYKLLQQIGEGGFGVVYMAEQRKPVRRNVAVKVIKPGMDSGQIVARFEAERQALAVMDHPNIARVFDGGTTESGRPYFVMELIKGVPITEYCDKNDLSMIERLKLFTTVCHALQHAHRKGVIHRDLKPTNIMVTLHDGQPVAKVIDFGVAKAINQQLTEKTLFTQYGQMVGTPQYMSPEQAEMSGLDVDTRADVYSLGIILYELLTGSTPLNSERLRAAGYAEIQRIICEEDPQQPSVRLSSVDDKLLTAIAGHRSTDPRQLRQLIRGELDWIVMKSLDKERGRRYESASALAADVERFLRHEPVEACPPSHYYRLRKFASRNRALLATATAISLILIVATAVSLSLAVQAKRSASREAQARQQAEADAIQAEKSAVREREAREAEQSQREELQETLYVADMRLAQQHWNAGDTSQMHARLDRHVPKPGDHDYRKWEWHHLKSMAQRNVASLQGHSDRVRMVAWSPDGERIASAGCDQTVRVWDAIRHEETLTLRDIKSDVLSVAWSPDSSQLAAVGVTGDAIVWDVATGKQVHAYPRDQGTVGAVAWHPGGQQIAVTDEHAVVVWNTDKDVELSRWKSPNTRAVIWSPDGKKLAGVVRPPEEDDYCELRVWDPASREEILSKTLPNNFNLFSPVWSPDGQQITVVADQNWALGSVLIWDAATGKQEISLSGIQRGIYAAAWSHTGTLLAVAGNDGIIRLYDSTSGQVVRILRGHGSLVRALSWSPDDQRLCSASDDRTVKVWDVNGSMEYLEVDGSSRVAWAPDGRRLACKPFSRTYYDPSGPKEDAEQSVMIFDVFTGKRIQLLARRERAWLGCLEWSSSGNRLAGGTPKNLLVWDPSSGEELLRRACRTSIALAWRPGHQQLALTDVSNKTIEIYDVDLQRSVAKFGSSAPRGVMDWHPDGTRLAVKRGDTIRVWEFNSDREPLKLDLQPFRNDGSGNVPASIAWSPDGSRLAAATGAGVVVVWDARTGHQELVLEGHSGTVWCVAWHPDGTRIASGGIDWQLKVWDTSTGEELLSFAEDFTIFDVAWDPTGHCLASASGPAGQVRVRYASPPGGAMRLRSATASN